MKRVVVAALLASAIVLPTVTASASPGFHAAGVISTVDAQRHQLTIRDSGGDKSLQNHTITVRTGSSTHVKRDGKASPLARLKPGDHVDATGHRNGGLTATTISATSPPRPDEPTASAPGQCLGYYLPCTPPLPPTSGGSQLSITISNFTFDPPVAVVPAGTIVTVTNADPFDHTFSGNHLDSGDLGHGKSFAVEFTTPGTYRFYCSIHPFMSGVLDVR
jgi:hypothetical protein